MYIYSSHQEHYIVLKGVSKIGKKLDDFCHTTFYLELLYNRELDISF